jgi:MFS family permease
MSDEQRSPDAFAGFRQFFAFESDVLVLSVAMFDFALAFQTIRQYIAKYLLVLGAGTSIIGLYGTLGNILQAVYPYPGGAFSDRVGSRYALTAFGILSTIGFGFWLFAPALRTLSLAGVSIPAWVWIFVGLFFVLAWKSLGLGATFAIVRQSVPPDRLATGFASTETFRRSGFFLGLLVAAGLFAVTANFLSGFQTILVVVVVIAATATLVQHVCYDASEDTIGEEFEGLSQLVRDLRSMPSELRPLLVGDTLIRFANGMVYVFFVLVITQILDVGITIFGLRFGPAAFFGLLLALELGVALVTMMPTAKVAQRVGLKPVIAGSFFVYAIFSVLLITAPANPLVLVVLFAFSGLRFAGLPAHKALVSGPAEVSESGQVTGSYYSVRNIIVIPSAALGGWLYSMSPTLAFSVATVIGRGCGLLRSVRRRVRGICGLNGRSGVTETADSLYSAMKPIEVYISVPKVRITTITEPILSGARARSVWSYRPWWRSSLVCCRGFSNGSLFRARGISASTCVSWRTYLRRSLFNSRCSSMRGPPSRRWRTTEEKSRI